VADLRRSVVKVSKADITLERGKQLPRPCDQIVTHATSRAGGRRRRECCGWMRDRGVCEADVDAVATASRQHDAWRLPGGCPAVSARGGRYWVMEIGGGRGGGASRDFSAEGGNAP
jgi:hypothetical protein